MPNLADILRPIGPAQGQDQRMQGRRQSEIEAMQAFFKSLQPKTIKRLQSEFSGLQIPVGQELTSKGPIIRAMQSYLQDAMRQMEDSKRSMGGKNLPQGTGHRGEQEANQVASHMLLLMLQGHLEPTKTAQEIINSGFVKQFQQGGIPIPSLRATPGPGSQQ